MSARKLFNQAIAIWRGMAVEKQELIAPDVWALKLCLIDQKI